jgi:hypothetical protein
MDTRTSTRPIVACALALLVTTQAGCVICCDTDDVFQLPRGVFGPRSVSNDTDVEPVPESPDDPAPTDPPDQLFFTTSTID